jgi:hypothetical protein
MKLKSLILGSVAAAGLSTAGFAADLGVLTSLDVCDELGLSGLTISSDTNCLQISGGVSYEFAWGDFRSERIVAHTEDSGARNIMVGNAPTDWTSKVEAWLKFVGTASSDFGPAKAVIKIKEVDITRVNRAGAVTTIDADGEADDFHIDEAYVQIGDTTVIMAGRKGSIANLGDDEPFNFLGLFNSDDIDGKGVNVDGDTTYLGGHVIQVVSDLGNGVTAGIALENLNMDSTIPAPAGVPAFVAQSGSLVGVLSYAGEGITAHATAAALGILDGNVESWFVHAGATGTFDAFKVRGAISYWDNKKFVAGRDVLNALLSVEGTFDMFKVAVSGEYVNNALTGISDYGVGGSIGATVTEGVSINLGARYFTSNAGVGDTFQVAAQLIAAVTETIKITAEVGGYFGDEINFHHGESVFYGAAELAWAPGGGFTSSIKGEANSENAYKVTFKAAKTFE